MLIDFRSDTVTKPTKGMLDAMMKANVGDDVFGEDPSINELESYAAALFSMEEGLFCPSGRGVWYQSEKDWNHEEMG